MEKRPWPIVVLALLHFFEPQMKLLFYSWFWNVPIWSFVNFMMSGKNVWGTFLFLFSFPIAGIAIFAVKKWSLPVFVTIQLITLIQHIHDSQLSPTHFPPIMIALFVGANLLVTTYFLLPAVRLAYVDPRVRWWEAAPRFQVRWPVRLTQEGQSIDAVIANVAEGGFFCEFEGRVTLDTTHDVTTVFSYQDFHFQIVGAIRHSRFDGKKSFYGVKFHPPSKETNLLLKGCMKTLDKQGFDRKPVRENGFKAFSDWAIRLLTTGKGLFPEVRSSFYADQDKEQPAKDSKKKSA